MIDNLANEILLRIFSELELPGIIASRGTCQKWRHLVPYTQFLPIRRAMLEFYDELVATPLFHQTRPWVLANLQKFDRQTYLNKLLHQYPSVPEDFSCWVLEWPARATVAFSWPGLPRKKYNEDYADDINVVGGVPWMVYPQVSALMVSDEIKRTAEYIPALLVHHHSLATWLLLDKRKEFSGKVFISGVAENRMVIAAGERAFQLNWFYPDWMAYQRRIWEIVMKAAESRTKAGRLIWSKVEDIPVENSEDSMADIAKMIAPAWLRKDRDAHAQTLLDIERDRLQDL
ncbi:hypothetical protein NLJ89_g601 [Agrocybe chaxingu]|uniref:F-box domain-containing protein n=1 Tax=Agrocybe chaxingu TaxID=84603 RepID=A0A9W8TGB5_9AGAR|nr:hypothetical protein NLJ89_g601 [Agrocybe chaxingu]